MSDQNTSSSPYQGLTQPQALATMRQLVKDESLNSFRMGQLYNYVVDSNLLKGTKHKNAADFFTDNIQEVSKATLLAYGAVARVFSQEVCTQFGITRLRLLLSYKVAAKLELNTADPGGTFIMVPAKDNEVKPKLFADCGVEDLRKALADLRTSGEKPIPAEEVALVDRYREAITGRFSKDTPVRVQLRSHQGKAVVDFKGIPLSQVHTLTEALLEQLYPVQEVPEVEEQPSVG
jgi:hypothetical protein